MRVLFLIALGIFPFVLLAQERVITYQSEDKELTHIFKELEKAYNIHFAFAVDEVKGKKVSIHAENQELSSFLTLLLAEHQLSFEIVEENFISVTKASSVLLRMFIRDEETDEALSFATARIKGTDQGYIADVKGNFEMIIANPSEVILEISYLGYEKKEIEVGKVAPSKSLAVSLKRSPQELQEIIVKEYLNKGITIDDQASRISIDIQNMEILPGLSERDILLSAQILAGIGSADESAGGLNVRGSSRDNTFIYWNKIPVYQSAHYFGNISAFIPSSIGKVDIFKNHIPVSYGGASSGLILINSRMPTAEKAIVESNLNLTHGDVYTSLPFANNNGRISIAARRSFNDALATPTFNSMSNKLFDGSLTEDEQGISEDFEYNSKLVFNDLNLVIDFNTAGDNEFSLSALSSQSKLDYDSEDDENSIQSMQEHIVRTFGGNFTWDRRWLDRLSSEWSISYADYHMDYSLINIRDEIKGTEGDLQNRINDLTNLESRFTLTYAPQKKHVIDLGYQFNRIGAELTIHEDFFFEDDFSESITSEGNTHGLFASYFGKLGSGLQIGLGLRHNKYEALEKTRLDRQLRLNYELTPGLLLKSTAGVYHQYISSLKEVDFVFSNTIEQNWITADVEEEIPVIKNEQVVLGALLTKGGWVVDIDGYIKRVFAPVARNFGPQPDDEEKLISGIETITGLDLTIKRRWKYYRAWLSYAFQDSEVEAIDRLFTSGLNIRHQFQLSQTMIYKQFEFSLGYTIRSGLPYTSAHGFEAVDPGNGEEPFIEIMYEDLNSYRLPAYQRLDVSTWYKFKKKKPSTLAGEIGISVLNVLNTSNLYSRTFAIEENDQDEIFLLRRDRKLIGITPNISVRLKF
ncbi:carboxypeptidase-like regulatory domain-containing protein [Fulvivirgaceae bacterium BMA10]|uniref:Carboxypeptidase-like regulatory domain-containing protein n=1 Tax=Splendidivirga corallicola TaxID=3051826 RepID=A0ABT8KQQ3_9BACT|nr:carboxypeptidase-like regulatory domain-containing protein [Fulvivirgaceae bacterium BMA10]